MICKPDSICIYSQNVNCNYNLTSDLLESLKDSTDVIFIQDPSWRLIRHAPSSEHVEGQPVEGLPIHPEWVIMFRNGTGDNRPRVASYFHKRLSPLRPAYRRDLIDHRDILVSELSIGNTDPHRFINVYNDHHNEALDRLTNQSLFLDHISFMAGDFNLRSRDWDPSFPGHDSPPVTRLVELGESLDLIRSLPETPLPTRYATNPEHPNTVLDLIWISDDWPGLEHHIHPDRRATSDHAPLTIELPLKEAHVDIIRWTIPKESEEETRFLAEAIDSFRLIDLELTPLRTPEDIEHWFTTVFDAIGASWTRLSKRSVITKWSKAWWTPECTELLNRYRETREREHWKDF